MTKSENKVKKKTMFTIKKWLIVQAVILIGVTIYAFYNVWTPQGNLALAIAFGMFLSYMTMFALEIYEDVKTWVKSKRHNKSGGEDEE